MFKESLYNFFSLQVSRLEEIILFPHAFDDEESIHLARVCLKKIKTVLYFMERLNIPGISVKQTFKKENEFFHILGDLREFYKQYKLIHEFEIKLSSSYYEYFDFIKMRENKKKKRIQKIPPFKIVNHIKYLQVKILKIIDMFDDTFLFDEACLFIKNEFEKMIAVKNNLDDIKVWHAIRKYLKNNMYLMTIIYESHYKSEITKETINDIDNLQDSIGNWHDNIVSFELLLSFIEKNKITKPENLNKYKKLIHMLS